MSHPARVLFVHVQKTGGSTVQSVLLDRLPGAEKLTGLAGALKTDILGFATLSDALWTTSGAVILMTLVGGMGTLIGPVLGAFLIVAEDFNAFGDAVRRKMVQEIAGLGPVGRG